MTYKIKNSPSRVVFNVCNYIFLSLMAVACIVPMVHILAISFSSNTATSAGVVGLWPVGFTVQAYEFVAKRPEFLAALWITVKRTFIGAPLSVLLTLLAAYPLSKTPEVFRFRTVYAWLFFFTMLFGGGLIPTYLIVSQTKLINTIWALVLPEAVAVYNILLMLNFFRGIPKELEEAAIIDGAGQFTVLFKVFIPISKASIATIVLFQLVFHWNEWFAGQIYMQKASFYPLQTYLRTLIAPDAVGLEMKSLEEMIQYNDVNMRNSKAAQIFVAALPIILTYPFLQRYFVKGVVLGSVKG